MTHLTCLILLFVVSFVTADICNTLREAGVSVESPLTAEYVSILNDYWSAACSALRPKCVFTPRNANEVSVIVTALRKTTDKFAVKSGGHMPNLGFSSIDDGVLIATKNLNGLIYNPFTQTVTIGPGLTWQDAQQGIADTGRTIVGGRMGKVGVGGYLLGGGLSFLSSQYGWAVNSLVDIEIVLANGTIVHANDATNAELFNAVKGGGGGNFGIITAYTLNTHPISRQIWGGNYVFPGSNATQLLAAVHEFTTNYPDDKAGIIVTAITGLLTDSFIVYLFYDGPSPPDHVFAAFRSIGPIQDTTKSRSYIDLVRDNNAVIVPLTVDVIATETTPLTDDPITDLQVLKSYYDNWKRTVRRIATLPDVFATMTYQPLSRTITRKAGPGTNTPGGSGQGLVNFPPTADYILFQYHFSYILGLVNEPQIAHAVRHLEVSTRELVDRHIAEGRLPDVPRPLYMNDMNGHQDYWGRIGEDMAAFARRVRESVDPEKWWQERTSGGWRVG
ncbi:hypothetical protein VTO42DRAFT_4817 [Malbranchea cinnamomea]